VIWSDFRDFWWTDLEGGDAIVVPPGTPYSSSPVDVLDLVIDAGQYTAEVQRVTDAREWESERWQIAKRLDEHLTTGGRTRVGGGVRNEWEFGYAEPAPGQPGKFLVTCWDEEIRRAIEVILTAGPGSPEDRAKVMADSFLATPETQWTVSRRINLGEN
jgi:hypothetical protein